MKGWLLDQNLPARLTFTPVLLVTSATAVASNPTDTAQLLAHRGLRVPKGPRRIAHVVPKTGV